VKRTMRQCLCGLCEMLPLYRNKGRFELAEHRAEVLGYCTSAFRDARLEGRESLAEGRLSSQYMSREPSDDA
jgi:hypothetical protein